VCAWAARRRWRDACLNGAGCKPGAPDLYIAELSNVLWKYYKAQKISHAECMQYVEDGIDLIDDFFEAKELWKEALGEGIKNVHSIYDMYYAVLARRNDALLMTNDEQLSILCKKLNVEVVEPISKVGYF
jgi:predicted nucleic acid-binding protein